MSNNNTCSCGKPYCDCFGAPAPIQPSKIVWRISDGVCLVILIAFILMALFPQLQTTLVQVFL